MTKISLSIFLAAACASALVADTPPPPEEPFKITADVIAADKTSGAMMASGNVHAVHKPYNLLSRLLLRDQEGTISFAPGTHATTCTNDAEHLHWGVDGEIVYRPYKSVLIRDATLRMFGYPIFWLPYLYMPSGDDYGYAVTPGWTSRWGAYLLNRFSYDIYRRDLADGETIFFKGSTRFDLRWEQGIAFGENIDWQLGRFGKGFFKIYYGYDNSSRYDQPSGNDWNYANWGSTVDKHRYAIALGHTWEVTERDLLRVNGILQSDSYMWEDYLHDRSQLFSFGDPWQGLLHENEFAWEHLENLWYVGVSASGPINDFDTGTRRLPEVYFDLAPMPVFSLPINYETENKFGYLQRHAAEYGAGANSVYGYNPGPWANYESFRFDTYHRLTAPMKFWDLLSVVPRVGYHGTIYSEGGYASLTGRDESGKTGTTPFRSIVEGGVTFAGRGTAWINDSWQHMVEPYFDLLLQEAAWSGLADDERAYVYDSIDMSRDWSDQFAGRGRNLPYSWYGATPGFRNSLRQADDFGNLHTVFDFDIYCALQFNSASHYGENDRHKLAENGKPNYGERGFMAVPGFRTRWFPDRDSSLSARLEYDSDHNEIAIGDITWRQQLGKPFSYYASLVHRNFRWWDFSSPAYDSTCMREDELGMVHLTVLDVGFEHEICDAVAWGPFVRWDCRENELDRIGTWIDYRLDCLGFRLMLSYDNSFSLVDGTEYDSEFNVGFMIYLRAFGPGSGLTIGGE